MIFRVLRSPRVLPGGILAALGLALLLPGCGDNKYPEELRYPVRTDPLVVELPTFDPVGFEKPGEILALLHDPRFDPAKDKALLRKVLFPGKNPYTGKVGIDPTLKTILGEELDNLFGSPRDPRVKGIDGPTRKLLALSDKQLKTGSELYRKHCVHCHGLSGDGRGPTAPWVNPHPRDYRQGLFKFTSSKQDQGSRKPRREDLLRTLRQGVEGTSMPSFGLLPDDELEALASYVIHLSVRGQTEFFFLQDQLSDQPEVEIPKKAKPEQVRKIVKGALRENLKTIIDTWVGAQKNILEPDKAYPYTLNGKAFYSTEDPDTLPGPIKDQLIASVRRGQRLFATGTCIGCHYDYGRGNRYLYDPWGNVVHPRNLTKGVYRGGRRPIDLFWRVNGGIQGAQMPTYTAGEQGAQDTWDLVNFLQVLPYPGMRKKYGVDIDFPVPPGKEPKVARTDEKQAPRAGG